MHRHQTSSRSLCLVAFLLVLVSARVPAQDTQDVEPEFIIEPGVLAFELDPDLPSTLNFDLDELENALCGDDLATLIPQVRKQGTADPNPPTPSIHLRLVEIESEQTKSGPLALCTEVIEPDRVNPFDEGLGVLINIDDSSALAKNGTTTIDLRPDILHFDAQGFDLSCGEWALEVNLFGDQAPSPAQVLSQGDHLGGLLTTDLHVELELLFTELQTGRTVTLLRGQSFSGAASWSSTAIDLGLADAAFHVRRAAPIPGEACYAVLELAARPFSAGWTAEKAPQQDPFCLVDWSGQGQLCLRPWVKE